MTKFFFAFAALLIAGCSTVTCEEPALYEPIDQCDGCHWERD